MRKPILSLLLAVVFGQANVLSAPSVLIGLGIAATATAASGKPPVQTSGQSAAPRRPTGGTIRGKVLLGGVPSGEIKVSVTPLRQLGAGASFNAMLARSEGEET